MSKHSKQKSTYTSSVSTKSIIGSFAVVIVFVALVVVFLWAISTEPKVPATSEEVWGLIELQGYEPEDYTELYHQSDVSFQNSLNKCIGFLNNDISFEFFEFNNQNSAENIYSQAYQKITKKYNSWQKNEISHHSQNYSLYFLNSMGKYNVAIYVGNTAVYAYCDSENMGEIDNILAKIDYLEFGNNKEKTE